MSDVTYMWHIRYECMHLAGAGRVTGLITHIGMRMCRKHYIYGTYITTNKCIMQQMFRDSTLYCCENGNIDFQFCLNISSFNLSLSNHSVSVSMYIYYQYLTGIWQTIDHNILFPGFKFFILPLISSYSRSNRFEGKYFEIEISTLLYIK